MSKFTIREKQLIFILIALIFLLITFKFAYVNTAEAIKKIDDDTLRLRGEVSKLNEYVRNKEKYDKEIQSIQTREADIINSYGAKVTPEKITLFLHDVGEKTGAEINDIGFGEKIMIDVRKKSRDKEQEKPETGGIHIYQNQVKVSLRADYSQLKAVIAEIGSNKEKMNIDSITSSLDHGSGKLNALIVLNAYEMVGTKKEYKEPNIDVPVGNNTPLGSK